MKGNPNKTNYRLFSKNTGGNIQSAEKRKLSNEVRKKYIYLLLPHLFSIVLEALPWAISPKK